MKYLTLITLALMATSAQADFWDNCTAYGGTIITANSYGNDKGGDCNDPNDTTKTNNCNGMRFCLGSKTMNFWSTFTWCESIGGEPASFDNLCPSCQQAWGYCPNLKKLLSSRDYYRGNTPRNSDSTWLFILQNGEIDYAGGITRAAGAKPICQEKQPLSLFPNTKIAEDDVQQFIYLYTAGNAP